MNEKAIKSFRVSGAQSSFFALSFDESPTQNSFFEHDHPCYEFFVFLSGDAKMEVAGTIHPLSPGDLLVIPRGVPHRLLLKSQAPYQRAVTYVFDAHLRALGLTLFADLLQREGFIKENITGSAFFKTLPQCAELSALAATDAAQELLFNDRLLCFCYALQDATRAQKPSPCDLLVERTVTYVNKNLCAGLSLDSIAEQLYASPSHLRKSFRRKMGMPLMHYVNVQRVRVAKELILEHLPLKEVFLRCGFENYVTFFRVFRKETGLSPSEFAERHWPSS